MSSNSTFVPPRVVHATQGELVTYLVLSFWPSHFGLPLLLAIIIFSSRVRRHATFISMCVTWIISGLGSSILIYTGQTTGPEPSKTTCLIQTSIVYAVPPMAATAALLLVLQTFTVVRANFKGDKLQRDSPLRLWAMLSAPYIVFLGFSIATAVIGGYNQEKISRDRRTFYCSMENPYLTDLLALFASAALLVTLYFTIRILIIVYKQWKALRNAKSNLASTLDFSLAVRIVIFGLYASLGCVVGILSTTAPTSALPDLAIASTSSAIIVVFGTQRDIRRAMCFWRRDKPTSLTYTGGSVDLKPGEAAV